MKPPRLKINDTVAIVSTARKLLADDLQVAIKVIENWGLKVKLGKYLFNQHHQFAGNDEERLQDLQENIDDPEVKAILCARGGYGSTRIIDRINFYKLYENPKWIAGFSDVTAIICQLHNLGIESIHSIMPLLFNVPESEEAVTSLRNILFGEEIVLQSGPHLSNRDGIGSGVVIGGNLSILVNSIGTGSEIDTKGKILFIEDLDEYLYHIDRMMVQLKRSGKLHALAGLAVGQMSDMKDNAVPFGFTAYEIIKSHTEGYPYPVCFDFPVGHVPHNLAIPCGRKGKLIVGKDKSILSF
ncbi:MAG: LD-carboxypeptidase [Bacteroidota bacterium]|nr:LD-carboxypeptidase [Bacteroidota bacterium]